MTVTCTGEGRVPRTAASGEVDHHRARAVAEELSCQIGPELPRSPTLDLEGVIFMDNSGTAVLLRAYRRLGELGGAVRVVYVPAQADKMLRTTGPNKLMEFE